MYISTPSESISAKIDDASIVSVNNACLIEIDYLSIGILQKRFFREHSVRGHSSITSSKRWVGGVRKWQFLIIYSTVNYQRVGWVGLKKSKT